MSIIQRIGVGIIGIIIAIGAAFFFSQKVIVDNPTSENIIVKIDNKEFTIEPLQDIEVSLYPGKHTVIIGDKEIGVFTKQYFDYGSILNPTKSTYVLESIPYGTIPTNWVDVHYKDVTIEGSVYNGPFKTITDLYFTKKHPLNFLQKDGYKWDYELDEHEPDEEQFNDSYKVFVKIYRFQDFVQMYNEDYNND